MQGAGTLDRALAEWSLVRWAFLPPEGERLGEAGDKPPSQGLGSSEPEDEQLV